MVGLLVSQGPRARKPGASGQVQFCQLHRWLGQPFLATLCRLFFHLWEARSDMSLAPKVGFALFKSSEARRQDLADTAMKYGLAVQQDVFC